MQSRNPSHTIRNEPTEQTAPYSTEVVNGCDSTLFDYFCCHARIDVRELRQSHKAGEGIDVAN